MMIFSKGRLDNFESFFKKDDGLIDIVSCNSLNCEDVLINIDLCERIKLWKESLLIMKGWGVVIGHGAIVILELGFKGHILGMICV